MGKALATKLAQQGANVCIVARNQAKLDQAIDHIKVLPSTIPICLLYIRVN
jgi:short-subunit dehydrogenase